MALSTAMPLPDRIETELDEEFGIHHVTIQLETGRGHGNTVIANGTNHSHKNHS